ncbi:MAG: hypothetical protein HY606_12565 [Planctomycetes bacterium]|nr:hypothetical protein [Planctomycetota bacterium]
MEVLLPLILICAAIFFVNRKCITYKKPIVPMIKSDEDSGNSNIKVSKIYATSDKGWILNPDTTFSLTIYNVNKSTALEIKKILDNSLTTDLYSATRQLMPIISQTNLVCKEVQHYINEYKPLYLNTIKTLQQTIPEWDSSSERDKNDLLQVFKEQAIQSLEIRPTITDVEALFEYEPADKTIDDALIDKFGFNNIQLYLRFYRNTSKVFTIPAKHRDRQGFERLVELGLAVRGFNISMAKILETLKLNDLNSLIADLNKPKFTRKAVAIEFLTGLSDIQIRLGKDITSRELFQLQQLPPEFRHINLADLSKNWKHIFEVSQLICHTYSMSAYATRDRHNSYSTFVEGWKLTSENSKADCPYCVRLGSRKYLPENPPQLPLHIGCRCGLVPIADLSPDGIEKSFEKGIDEAMREDMKDRL